MYPENSFTIFKIMLSVLFTVLNTAVNEEIPVSKRAFKLSIDTEYSSKRSVPNSLSDDLQLLPI